MAVDNFTYEIFHLNQSLQTSRHKQKHFSRLFMFQVQLRMRIIENRTINQLSQVSIRIYRSIRNIIVYKSVKYSKLLPALESFIIQFMHEMQCKRKRNKMR